MSRVRDARSIVGPQSSSLADLEASELGPPGAIEAMPAAATRAVGPSGELIKLKPMRHFAWKYAGKVGSHRGKQSLTKNPFRIVTEARNHKHALTFAVRAYYNRHVDSLKKGAAKAGKLSGKQKEVRQDSLKPGPEWHCIGRWSPAFMIGSTRNLKLSGATPKRRRPRPYITGRMESG